MENEVHKLVAFGYEDGFQVLFAEALKPDEFLNLFSMDEVIEIIYIHRWNCRPPSDESILEEKIKMRFGDFKQKIEGYVYECSDLELEFVTESGFKCRYVNQCEMHLFFHGDQEVHPIMRSMLKAIVNTDISEELLALNWKFCFVDQRGKIKECFDTQMEALDNGNDEKYQLW